MNETKKLAEHIARLLESEPKVGDLASVFASLEKINHRLDKLEATASNRESAILTSQLNHPSQEKFAVIEAFADEVAGMNQEKTCTFEPNGRPCDYCSMCSSRGF